MPIRSDPLPFERGKLGRSAANGERTGATALRIGRPLSAAWNASATTVRSGSSGTAAIVAARTGVLDSPGPERQDS